jgi:hypothetical protein
MAFPATNNSSYVTGCDCCACNCKGPIPIPVGCNFINFSGIGVRPQYGQQTYVLSGSGRRPTPCNYTFVGSGFRDGKYHYSAAFNGTLPITLHYVSNTCSGGTGCPVLAWSTNSQTGDFLCAELIFTGHAVVSAGTFCQGFQFNSYCSQFIAYDGLVVNIRRFKSAAAASLTVLGTWCPCFDISEILAVYKCPGVPPPAENVFCQNVIGPPKPPYPCGWQGSSLFPCPFNYSAPQNLTLQSVTYPQDNGSFPNRITVQPTQTVLTCDCVFPCANTPNPVFCSMTGNAPLYWDAGNYCWFGQSSLGDVYIACDSVRYYGGQPGVYGIGIPNYGQGSLNCVINNPLVLQGTFTLNGFGQQPFPITVSQ